MNDKDGRISQCFMKLEPDTTDSRRRPVRLLKHRAKFLRPCRAQPEVPLGTESWGVGVLSESPGSMLLNKLGSWLRASRLEINSHD